MSPALVIALALAGGCLFLAVYAAATVALIWALDRLDRK